MAPGRPRSRLNAFARGRRPARPNNLVLLVVERVIVDEELLEFFHEPSAKVVEARARRHVMRLDVDGDETIVLLAPLALALLASDHAEQPAYHQAAWKGRLIHEH